MTMSPLLSSVLLGCALGAGLQGLACAQDVNPVTPAAAPPAASAPAPASKSKPTSAQSEAGEPRAATSSAAAKAGAPKRGKSATDRVDLDTTTVTGNRELPKVMYVVPWKRSDIGDLIGRPANSLLDEVLTPVDRNVFRREVQYYQALKPDTAAAPGPAAPGPAAPQVEK